jgi:hypothetical protein
LRHLSLSLVVGWRVLEKEVSGKEVSAFIPKMAL